MITKNWWVGAMAQSVKCLSCQQEDLSSSPTAHLKVLNTVVPTCTPVLRKWKVAGPWGSLASQNTYTGELQASERPCLHKQDRQRLLKGIWPLHTVVGTPCTHVHTHTHRNVTNETGIWRPTFIWSEKHSVLGTVATSAVGVQND